MRSELVVDQALKPVAALGCGCEAKPMFGRYSVEDVEEDAGGDVVAFVDNHETVAGREVFDVFPAGEGGQQRDIDDAAGFGSPAADLSALDSEVLLQSVAPLVGERFAVDQNERRSGAGCDRGAGDYRLARSRRCDEHTGVLINELSCGRGLLDSKWGRTAEFVAVAGGALVVDAQCAAG